MSLTSGSRVIRYRWTKLPMPIDVINRVNHMGRSQGMSSLIYENDSDDDDDSDNDVTAIMMVTKQYIPIRLTTMMTTILKAQE